MGNANGDTECGRRPPCKPLKGGKPKANSNLSGEPNSNGAAGAKADLN